MMYCARVSHMRVTHAIDVCLTCKQDEDTTWNVLKPEIFSAIMDHFASGDPILRSTASSGENGGQEAHPNQISTDDSETVQMIKELLETRIRPAVMEDGGDIVFRDFDEETGTCFYKQTKNLNQRVAQFR